MAIDTVLSSLGYKKTNSSTGRQKTEMELAADMHHNEYQKRVNASIDEVTSLKNRFSSAPSGFRTTLINNANDAVLSGYAQMSEMSNSKDKAAQRYLVDGIISEAYGVPLEKVQRNRKAYIDAITGQTNMDDKGFLQAFGDAWSSFGTSRQIANLMNDYDSADDDVMKGQILQKIQKLEEKLIKQGDYNADRGLIGGMVVDSAPIMRQGLEAAAWAVGTSILFSAAAAPLAGAFGLSTAGGGVTTAGITASRALKAWRAVTGAEATAGKVGSIFGKTINGILNVFQVERGMASYEMLKDGVEDDSIRYWTSIATGAVNTFIEFATIDPITGRFFSGNEGRRIVNQVVRSKIKEFGLEYLQNVFSESKEEGLQGFFGSVIQDIGKAIYEGGFAEGQRADTIDRIFNEGLSEGFSSFWQTLGPMAVSGAVSMTTLKAGIELAYAHRDVQNVRDTMSMGTNSYVIQTDEILGTARPDDEYIDKYMHPVFETPEQYEKYTATKTSSESETETKKGRPKKTTESSGMSQDAADKFGAHADTSTTTKTETKEETKTESSQETSEKASQSSQKEEKVQIPEENKIDASKPIYTAKDGQMYQYNDGKSPIVNITEISGERILISDVQSAMTLFVRKQNGLTATGVDIISNDKSDILNHKNENSLIIGDDFVDILKSYDATISESKTEGGYNTVTFKSNERASAVFQALQDNGFLQTWVETDDGIRITVRTSEDSISRWMLRGAEISEMEIEVDEPEGEADANASPDTPVSDNNAVPSTDDMDESDNSAPKPKKKTRKVKATKSQIRTILTDPKNKADIKKIEKYFKQIRKEAKADKNNDKATVDKIMKETDKTGVMAILLLSRATGVSVDDIIEKKIDIRINTNRRIVDGKIVRGSTTTPKKGRMKVQLNQHMLFHGGLALFDRFSNDFIGTGEGSQVYGMGLYFSASRRIAEGYASRGYITQDEYNHLKDLYEHNIASLAELEEIRKDSYWIESSNVDIVRRYNRLMNGTYIVEDIRNVIHGAHTRYSDVKDLINSQNARKPSKVNEGGDTRIIVRPLSDAYDWDKFDPKVVAQILRLSATHNIEDMYDNDVTRGEIAYFESLVQTSNGRWKPGSEFSGHLYTVEIPDGKYLNWNNVVDAKEVASAIEKMSFGAQKALEKLGLTTIDLFVPDFESKITGEDLYNALTEAYEETADSLFDWDGAKQKASDTLAEAGYLGIVYNAGTRLGLPAEVRQGTKNFVVFNADNVTIVQHELYQTLEDARKDVEFQSAYDRGDYATMTKMLLEKAESKGLDVKHMIAEHAGAWKLRQGPKPKKTMTMYKVFYVDENGEPSALFVNGKSQNFPMNTWIDAVDAFHFESDNGQFYVPTQKNPNSKDGKATGVYVVIKDPEVEKQIRAMGFSVTDEHKVLAVAYRPGLHGAYLPVMGHLGVTDPEGSYDETEAPFTEMMHHYNQVVFEIEIDADKEYLEADGVGENGLDHIPEGGFYYFGTNPKADTTEDARKNSWIITGSMKIVRALSEEEVNSILDKHEARHQHWQSPDSPAAKRAHARENARRKKAGLPKLPRFRHFSAPLNLEALNVSTDPVYDGFRKTLAPATFDENGNLIPLSQRFNMDSSDVLYQQIGEIGADRLEDSGHGVGIGSNLAFAKEMDADGESTPEEIWIKTGWYKGVDGNWRYEIPDYLILKELPDKDSIFSPDDVYNSKEYKLEDYLDNVILEAYPQLRDKKLIFRRDLGSVHHGYADSEGINININAGDMREVFAHELQHLIQGEEDFASGGSSEYVNLHIGEGRSKALAKIEARDPVTAALVNLRSYLMRWELFLVSDYDESNPGPSEDYITELMSDTLFIGEDFYDRDITRVSERELRDFIDTIERKTETENNDAEMAELINDFYYWDSAGQNDSYNNYRHLAGEVEARNTASRYGANDYSKIPLDTMDTPNILQIVLKNDGVHRPSFSQDAPRNNGKFTITLNQDADLSTILHEVGHVMRYLLTDDQLKAFEQEYSMTLGKGWADSITKDKDGYHVGNEVFATLNEAKARAIANEERFVADFTQYCIDGLAPNNYLSDLFQKLKDFLRTIFDANYRDLSDTLRAAFDQLFAGDEDESLDVELHQDEVAERAEAEAEAGVSRVKKGGRSPNNQGMTLTVEQIDMLNKAGVYISESTIKAAKRSKELTEAQIKILDEYEEERKIIKENNLLKIVDGITNRDYFYRKYKDQYPRSILQKVWNWAHNPTPMQMRDEFISEYATRKGIMWMKNHLLSYQVPVTDAEGNVTSRTKATAGSKAVRTMLDNINADSTSAEFKAIIESIKADPKPWQSFVYTYIMDSEKREEGYAGSESSSSLMRRYFASFNSDHYFEDIAALTGTKTEDDTPESYAKIYKEVDDLGDIARMRISKDIILASRKLSIDEMNAKEIEDLENKVKQIEEDAEKRIKAAEKKAEQYAKDKKAELEKKYKERAKELKERRDTELKNLREEYEKRKKEVKALYETKATNYKIKSKLRSALTFHSNGIDARVIPFFQYLAVMMGAKAKSTQQIQHPGQKDTSIGYALDTYQIYFFTEDDDKEPTGTFSVYGNIKAELKDYGAMPKEVAKAFEDAGLLKEAQKLENDILSGDLDPASLSSEDYTIILKAAQNLKRTYSSMYHERVQSENFVRYRQAMDLLSALIPGFSWDKKPEGSGPDALSLKERVEQDYLQDLANKYRRRGTKNAEIAAVANFGKMSDMAQEMVLQRYLLRNWDKIDENFVEGDEEHEGRPKYRYFDHPADSSGVIADTLSKLRELVEKPQRLFNEIDYTRSDTEKYFGEWAQFFLRQTWNAQNKQKAEVNRRLQAMSKKFYEIYGFHFKDKKRIDHFGRMVPVKCYTTAKDSIAETNVMMPIGQVIGIYLYSLQGKGSEAWAKLVSSTGNNITQDQVQAIADGALLTENDRKWARALITEMGTKTQAISTTAYEVDNMIIPFLKNYFPLTGVDKVGQIMTDFTTVWKGWSGVNDSETINRTSSDYALNLDVTAVWMSAVSEQEHYLNFYKWHKRAQWLMSKTGANMTQNLRTLTNDTNAKMVVSYVNRVAKIPNTLSDLEKSMNVVISNAAAAKIAFSFLSVLRQLVSFVTGAMGNSIGTSNVIRGFFKCMGGHGVKEAMEKDINIAERNLSIDIQTFSTADRKTALGEMAKWPTDKALNVMRRVDRRVAAMVWWGAYYKYMEEHPTAGMTLEQADKVEMDARYYASQIVNETQSSSDILTQSELQLNKNPWVRTVLMFTQDLFQMWNRLWYDLPMEWRRRDKSELFTEQNIKILELAATPLIVGLVGAFLQFGWIPEDDDDEDGYWSWGDFIRDYGSEILQEFIPILGPTFADGLNGWSSDYSMFPTDIFTLGRTVWNHDWEKLPDDAFDVGVDILELTGLPSQLVKRTRKTFWDEEWGFQVNLGYLLLNSNAGDAEVPWLLLYE